jgi:hypothetical protein
MEAKPDGLGWRAKFVTLKSALLAGAILLFVTGAVAAFYSPLGAWPLCIAGIALVVVAHFDQISEISASATGAKVVLKQVQERVVELKQLVALSSKMHLFLAQHLGRWSTGFSEEERAAILHDTEKLMAQAGLTEQEIKDIRADAWDRMVHLDYVFWATKHVHIVGSLPEDWRRLQDLSKPGTPDEVEAMLKRDDKWWTPDAEKIIDRYRYYVEHGRHLDPAAWVDPHKPGA